MAGLPNFRTFRVLFTVKASASATAEPFVIKFQLRSSSVSVRFSISICPIAAAPVTLVWSGCRRFVVSFPPIILLVSAMEVMERLNISA